ncbi:hypothetical protein ABTX99_18990 [Streptomyces flaveolus]|uniref:hypothetical protein n=1 Tax=Streptomyces flaveolus TaxID=67297 RepID=UPI00333305F3
MSLSELPSETRKAVIAERRKELAGFWPGAYGAGERTAIKMYPLLYTDKPGDGHALIPAREEMRLRKIVEAFGQCFRRELRFDFPPFDAAFVDVYGQLNGAEVVLFDAQGISATFPIAAGAAGLSFAGGHRVLDWIWLHPFERGRDLMPIAWADLEATYGDDFLVRGPLSPAMRGFLTRQGVDHARWKKRQG